MERFISGSLALLLMGIAACTSAPIPTRVSAPIRRPTHVPTPLPTRTPIPQPSPLPTSRLHEVTLDRDSNSFQVFLGFFSIDEGFSPETRALMDSLPISDRRGFAREKKVGDEILKSKFLEEIGFARDDRVFMTIVAEKRPFVFPLSTADFLQIEESTEGATERPFERFSVRFRVPVSAFQAPHSHEIFDQSEIFGVAAIEPEGASPFQAGELTESKFEVDTSLDEGARKEISAHLVLPPVEETRLYYGPAGPALAPSEEPAPPLPVRIQASKINPSGSLSALYAEVGALRRNMSDSGPVVVKYLLALKRSGKSIEILEKQNVSSSYDRFPIHFFGGRILKSSEYLLLMDSEDAWHCPKAYFIRDDGAYEARTLRCEPSSC